MDELARRTWQQWVAGATTGALHHRLENWDWEYIAASDAARDDDDYRRRVQTLDWKHEQIHAELTRRFVAHEDERGEARR